MPIFDYLCEKCGTKIEQIVESYKVDKIKCNKCGAFAKKQFPDTFDFELKYDPMKDRVSWGDYNSTRRNEEYDKMAKKNAMIQVPK
jgi:putative FmdB family regulatory protein